MILNIDTYNDKFGIYNIYGSISSKVSSVTHSLWGWCQPRSATGTTWCSPPLWLYSSSASIASDNIVPILLTTLGHQNVTYCNRNRGAPPSLQLRVRTTQRITSECEIDSWTPFLLLFLLPNSHTTPPPLPCMNISSGFSFEVDHLCPPPRQLAQRPPSFFYTEVRSWNAEPLPSGSAAG